MFSELLPNSPIVGETSIGNMPKTSAVDSKYASMEVDALNNPHIAYYDADNGRFDLYNKYDGWNWNTTTGDSTGDVGVLTPRLY